VFYVDSVYIGKDLWQAKGSNMEICFYLNTMLINTGVAPNMPLTINSSEFCLATSFPWQSHDLWSIPCLFHNSCQIPWHFQVFQKSGHPVVSCFLLLLKDCLMPLVKSHHGSNRMQINNSQQSLTEVVSHTTTRYCIFSKFVHYTAILHLLLLSLPPLSKRRRYCAARRTSVMLSRCVCVSVCWGHDCVRHISHSGEGNALYPVLPSCFLNYSWVKQASQKYPATFIKWLHRHSESK